MDVIVAIILILQTLLGLTESYVSPCPPQCICYNEYLTSLESWKWIERDIRYSSLDEDQEHEDSYLELNEARSVPSAADTKRLRSRPFFTAICIIRNQESLHDMINHITADVEVLSIIQAPGSGNITVQEGLLSKLSDRLIGLEIQGYASPVVSDFQPNATFSVEADALKHFSNLKFLSFQKAQLEVKLREGNVLQSKYSRKLFTYVTERVQNKSRQGITTITFLEPIRDNNTVPILPYNEYKTKVLSESKRRPLDPKFYVAFTNLKSLIHLKISGCEFLQLKWDIFDGLLQLQYLLLENNNLLFLPEFLFYAAPNISTISLHNNKILSLQTVGLAGLLRLQRLDMSQNNLTHLSELSLPPFPHLQIADFRKNPIQAIFPNTFEIMNTTKVLLIGSISTALEFFPNSFQGLKLLERLYLKNVNVAILEKAMLNGLHSLKNLEMNGKITEISFDAFNECSKLKVLTLRKAGIRKISMDSFYGLDVLKQLDLSKNELSVIPPGLFDYTKSLEELKLSANLLKTLPPALFEGLTLKMARLDRNPWHCDCRMQAWNFKNINVVKRHKIKMTKTSCENFFLKKPICPNGHDIEYVTKYAHDNRVTPMCTSPKKYKDRNIIYVVKKMRKNCRKKAELRNAKRTYKNEFVMKARNNVVEKAQMASNKIEDYLDKEVKKDANWDKEKHIDNNININLHPSNLNWVFLNQNSHTSNDIFSGKLSKKARKLAKYLSGRSSEKEDFKNSVDMYN